MISTHYRKDRVKREELIKQIGTGEVIATFRVDRNHKNGMELHMITSNGIIIIKNERTNKVITKLIARPNQIKRYFDKETKEVKAIMKIAYEHQRLGYNLI